MKKIVALFAFLVFFTGCSNDNKITINNMAADNIYFNFRAKKYTITTDETIVITDIPNGSYMYATTYQIPSGATSWSIDGAAASGSLTFQKKDTQVLLLYASTTTEAGAYNVNVNSTSTISTTTTASITGP